jgi:hypothetical protein
LQDQCKVTQILTSLLSKQLHTHYENKGGKYVTLLKKSFGKGTQGTLEEVPEFSLRRALAYDTNWICTEADAIFMLKGWEKSRGATAEHALAIALGHEIIYA